MATKTKQAPAATDPVLVAISDIWMDDQTQSRTTNNEELIEHYAELIRDGVEMPPVVLFEQEGEYFIGDGIHRCHAHMTAQLEEVWAIVHPGGLKEAQVYACGANKTHGLHRTNADKRNAAAIMLRLEPKWSNRRIADHVGVSDKTVAEARKELETGAEIPHLDERQGKDGKTYAKPQLSDSDSCADDQPAADDFENPFGPPTVPDSPTQYSDDFDPESIETSETGWTLEAEAEIYRRAVNDLNRMRRELEQASRDQKRGVHLADKIVRITKQLDEVRADIRGAEPVAICDDCQGDGCKRCGNAGFITRAIQERRGKR